MDEVLVNFGRNFLLVSDRLDGVPPFFGIRFEFRRSRMKALLLDRILLCTIALRSLYDLDRFLRALSLALTVFISALVIHGGQSFLAFTDIYGQWWSRISLTVRWSTSTLS